MSSNEFITSILAYLAGLENASSIEITPDTDLIESGVIDSFSITLLILHIEEILGIEININDPTMDSIRTVRRMDLAYNAKAA